MGNQRTTLSLAGAMDVHTFGKLKAALNVVQSNGQLAQGSSFQGFQGRRSQSWDSPHSTILCTGQGRHADSDWRAALLQHGQGPHLEVSLGQPLMGRDGSSSGRGEEEKRGERPRREPTVVGNQPGTMLAPHLIFTTAFI